MKVLAINTFNIGSTGKIMYQISKLAVERGVEYYICCPAARDNYKKKFENQIFIGNRVLRNIHGMISSVTGLEGFFSIVSTLHFLKKVDEIKPDIIHLHNIHGSYINFFLLFNYIKIKNIKVVWTLHDCWSFTGHCPYFEAVNCNKWKYGCNKCEYPHDKYPYTKMDSSNISWKLKKRCFNNVKDLILVTPSNWLKKLVEQSFLERYPVYVINNGIDLKTFSYTPSTTFRRKYKIEGKKIILGVAFGWDERKGLDVFIKLNEKLDKNFVIVLVGTNANVDMKLPSDIISIHRTENQKELAEIYSTSDVFVNPTREDNYPTVNMEAIACGVPVITFRTGGSPEMLKKGCGVTVGVNDIDGIIANIYDMVSENRQEIRQRCLQSAKEFDLELRLKQYCDLYDRLIKN